VTLLFIPLLSCSTGTNSSYQEIAKTPPAIGPDQQVEPTSEGDYCERLNEEFESNLSIIEVQAKNLQYQLKQEKDYTELKITGQRVGMVPYGEGLRDDQIERMLAEVRVVFAEKQLLITKWQMEQTVSQMKFLADSGCINLDEIQSLIEAQKGQLPQSNQVP
jgi:hypothetical protein